MTRLNTEVNRIIADAAIRERMAGLNIDLQGGSPEEFAAFIHGEAGKIRDLVRASGIKAD